MGHYAAECTRLRKAVPGWPVSAEIQAANFWVIREISGLEKLGFLSCEIIHCIDRLEKEIKWKCILKNQQDNNDKTQQENDLKDL